MSALPKRFFTPHEYLLLEEHASYRSQYVAGEIFAMAGAHPAHLDICSNIVGMLHAQFRGRGCRVYSADARVSVEAGEMYTYPDVLALCGQPKFDTAHNPPSLLNPEAIFEVLSPSTAAFDRGDKFTRYRKLGSLTDYVLVATDGMDVEHFARQPDGDIWTLRRYRLPEESVRLGGLGCELPLAEIYQRVEFPSERA